jgi:hypothetical protein
MIDILEIQQKNLYRCRISMLTYLIKSKNRDRDILTDQIYTNFTKSFIAGCKILMGLDLI